MSTHAPRLFLHEPLKLAQLALPPLVVLLDFMLALSYTRRLGDTLRLALGSTNFLLLSARRLSRVPLLHLERLHLVHPVHLELRDRAVVFGPVEGGKVEPEEAVEACWFGEGERLRR